MSDPAAIPKVRFGTTDLLVTRLCQGTAFRNMARSALNEEGEKILRHCLDAGVNFVDSAIAYGWGGSEELLGKVIAGRRDQVVICTKVPPTLAPQSENGPGEPARFTQSHLESQLEGSLTRLGTDYLDLFLLHSPDSVTPAAEICASMDSFVGAGKIRYWGVSNHSAEFVKELYATAMGAGSSPPAGIEDYYTIAGVSTADDFQSRPRLLESDMFPVVRELGLGVLAFSPMDQGHLAPGREPEPGSPLERICQTLDAVADDLSVSRAEVCVAWVLARPEVTSVLAGIERRSHVDQMLAATSLDIPPEQKKALDEASERFSKQWITYHDR